ncbi:hypothetical protein OC861_005036 [Tilletia horrida]|nr:hypothetical protein OC861_005036 [Tilletia horrida]
MPQGDHSWWSSRLDKENQRRIREQICLSEIHAFIKGTLSYLHRQRYTERAFGLFDIVRRNATERMKKLDELWKAQQAALGILEEPTVQSASTDAPNEEPSTTLWRRKPPNRLFTWGYKAKSLAVACVYSTIYTAEPDSVISLEEVIHACGEAASHRSLSIRSVVKRLRLVRQYGGDAYAQVKEDAPRFYIPAMIDFFEALIDGESSGPAGNGGPVGKGKARELDESATALHPSLSGVQEFLNAVRIPLARTLAPELAHALEEANFPPPPQRAGSKMAVDGLASAWRETRMDMELTAYAIVMWALEGSARTIGPQQVLIELCRYAGKGAEGASFFKQNHTRPCFKQGNDTLDGPIHARTQNERENEDDEQDVKLVHDDRLAQAMPTSKTTLQWRYSNIRSILSDYAKHLPWVLSASIIASSRRVQMHSRSTYSKKMSATNIEADGVELNRSDIVTWMRDILSFRDAADHVEADESLGRRLRRKTAYPTETGPERWHSIADFTDQFVDPGSQVISPNEKNLAPVDSNAVSRFKARLDRLVPGSSTVDQSIESLGDKEIDQVLFDSDEEFESTYLRSDLERQLVEQKLREDGGWELDEQRMHAREMREKMQKEKLERKTLKEERKRKYDLVLADLEHSKSGDGPSSKRAKSRADADVAIAGGALPTIGGDAEGPTHDGKAESQRKKRDRTASLQEEDILYTSSDEEGDESIDEG